jgi:hypothetical protein
MLTRIRAVIANWLFKDVTVDKIHTEGMRVQGGHTLYVDIWDWDHNTSDPGTPTESQVWYNSTDATMKYRTDSETVSF